MPPTGMKCDSPVLYTLEQRSPTFPTWRLGRGGREWFFVSGRHVQAHTGPFAQMVGAGIHCSHKWSFARECECLPLAQVKWHAQAPTTLTYWFRMGQARGLGAPALHVTPVIYNNL